MDTQSGKKYAVYSRKSKFTGKGESVENQIELCRRYILTHDQDVVDGDIAIFEDEGFSGGTTERPQFKRMMAEAKRRPFQAVVCYRLDRISRNIGDFAVLIEELEMYGTAFVSIREQFDTNTPMGRAMMFIASVFSQLERETIAERIRDNMRELARTGRWLGGTTPTGYASESADHVTVDGKRKKACKLKLIPEEASHVREIFERFLSAGSVSAVETWLLQTGRKTKRGKDFTRFAVRNILTNPVYMAADARAYEYLSGRGAELSAGREAFDGTHGVMAYNRTLQKAGRAHQLRPIDEWIISVGGHEGIVSASDWIRVQEMLKDGRLKASRRPRSNAALLSGLLVCGQCGGPMRPKLGKRVNLRGERIFSYVCKMREVSRGQRCVMKNIEGNALDRGIMDIIIQIDESREAFVRALDDGKKALSAGREDTDEELRRLRDADAEYQMEIRALTDALAKTGGSAADYVAERINALHGECMEIRERIRGIEELASGRALTDDDLEQLCKKLASICGALDDMDAAQKRNFLRALIARVEWDGNSAHVYLLGESSAPQCENSK